MRPILYYNALNINKITFGWNGWNSIFGKIIVIVCWSVDLTEHSMTLSVSIVLHSIIIGWRLNKKARHCDVTGLS